MVLRNKVDQVCKEEVRLVFRNTVYSLSEAFVYEDRFPTRHRYSSVSSREC